MAFHTGKIEKLFECFEKTCVLCAFCENPFSVCVYLLRDIKFESVKWFEKLKLTFMPLGFFFILMNNNMRVYIHRLYSVV